MHRQLPFSLGLLFGFLVLLASCGSGAITASKPIIVSFTASPASLPAGGGNVTLRWDVKNASLLSVDGDVGVVTGNSTSVNVTSNTTFTLTAANDEGSTTQKTSVSVEADTTPPTVTSVNPPDGAKGVTSDASIVITFSEAMDQAVTQVAYTSTDLPASAVTFNWNTEGTVLTIKPNDVLEYAASDDNPDIKAKTYALRVTNAAKDTAGNALAPFSSSFSTLRRIEINMPRVDILSGAAYSNNTFQVRQFPVGDALNPFSNTNTIAAARTFFTFDLSAIPNGVKSTDIADATLTVYKIARTNDPYFLFGLVRLDHVNYGPTTDNSAGAIFNTPSLASLGVFDDPSKEDETYLYANVTTTVIEDLTNRASRDNLNQYRLAFPGISTNNDGNENYVFYLPLSVNVTLLLP